MFLPCLGSKSVFEQVSQQHIMLENTVLTKHYRLTTIFLNVLGKRILSIIFR